MKITAVEGNTQRLDGGAMFGNCPKSLWEKWINVDALNRIPLACRAMLVQTDEGRNVLFETGVGSFFEPKYRERYGILEEEHLLLQNLEKLGVRETDIDQVILSHLHFDHAGGVLSAYKDGPTRLLFPNARFYTGRTHLERAQNPHIRDRASFVPLINELLIQSGRLNLLDGPQHPDLDFGVSFRFVEGHTPGMIVSILEHENGPFAFVADLIPGMAWIHLPLAMGYDRFPELVVNEKQQFLEEMVKRQAKLFFTHDPQTACATIHHDESGKFMGRPYELHF